MPRRLHQLLAPSSPRRRTTGAAVLVAVLGAGLLTTTGAAASAPPGGTPDRGNATYVAMGDSFAAGNGTGVPDLDPTCRRSSLAYAPLVAAERPRTDLRFVACSGADTGTVLEHQMSSLDRGTDFVTLSVGGNDVGFQDLATECVGGGDLQCQAAAQQTAVLLLALPKQLDAVYAAVGDRVRKAEVVVVGYPRFFPLNFPEGFDSFSPFDSTRPCPNAFGVTAGEAAALNVLTDTLNAVIADRATAAGFTYLSPVEAFTGHDMCASDPWVNGVLVNGVPVNSSLVNGVPFPSVLDAYHPSTAGYSKGFAPLIAAELQRQPSVSRRLTA